MRFLCFSRKKEVSFRVSAKAEAQESEARREWKGISLRKKFKAIKDEAEQRGSSITRNTTMILLTFPVHLFTVWFINCFWKPLQKFQSRAVSRRGPRAPATFTLGRCNSWRSHPSLPHASLIDYSRPTAQSECDDLDKIHSLFIRQIQNSKLFFSLHVLCARFMINYVLWRGGREHRRMEEEGKNHIFGEDVFIIHNCLISGSAWI